MTAWIGRSGNKSWLVGNPKRKLILRPQLDFLTKELCLNSLKHAWLGKYGVRRANFKWMLSENSNLQVHCQASHRLMSVVDAQLREALKLVHDTTQSQLTYLMIEAFSWPGISEWCLESSCTTIIIQNSSR